MKATSLAVGLAVVFGTWPCQAMGPANGAAILKACDLSAPTSREREVCDAYINGFIFGIWTAQMPAEKGGSPICLPDTVSTDMVRTKIDAFIRANPTVLTANGNVVTGLAMQTSFPCPNSN
jgi:hypothetical protein